MTIHDFDTARFFLGDITEISAVGMNMDPELADTGDFDGAVVTLVNAAGTVADEKVVTAGGVTILGYTDLAGRLAAQTSQLYGTNIVNLLKLLTPAKDGVLTLDMDDVVQRGITVTRDGAGMWPPPPVQVSAAPTGPAAEAKPVAEPKAPMSPAKKVGLSLVGILLFGGLIAISPQPLPQHFTVLILAIVIGYYVIGNVAHALHTPLMSVTNAISGVVVVGALLQIAVGDVEHATTIRVLSAIAILVASINVFGGFAVTRRMLAMFSKGA